MSLGRTALLLVAAALVPISLCAQSTTVVVSVADAATGAPLPNAQVRIPAAGRLGRADWLGEVRLAGVPGGRQTVEVRAMGYAASDITLDVKGDTVGAVFLLERVATALDTVKVSAASIPMRLEAYEWRRKTGIGRFLTDSLLQYTATQDIALTLATRLPGLQLAADAGSQWGIVGTGGCKVDVYLDGAMFSDSSVISRLWPRDLTGVELYSMVSAPPQFRRAGGIGPNGHDRLACKVLLLWSKY